MAIHSKDEEIGQRSSPRQEELAHLIGRFTGSDGIYPTSVEPLLLCRASSPGEASHVMYQPSLCVVAQGSKRLLLGKDVFRYDPAHFLLASVELPTLGQVVEASPKSPFLALSLKLDLNQMAALAMEADIPTPPAKPTAARGIAVSRFDAPLLDALIRLVRLLDSPQDVRVLAPMAVREVMYRLLTGEQGARLRKITAANSKTNRVARVMEWIKEHYAERLHIETIAREVCMSPSGLHHDFKAVTAMSPLQYQKQLRLQEARRLMLSGALDATAASYRVGYESPSQFSREYSRLFGAPPLRDIVALRRGDAARP
ncbi:MAG: AraC family transcriptional regulator [Akkermansiaceae bacterium]|nr:AraC family transcriptional regulator [Armatimonadota bacterium]